MTHIEPMDGPIIPCPTCGHEVKDLGAGFYVPVEPEVLATGWVPRDNPFKVRTPKGAANDIPVFIVAAPGVE